MWLLRLVPTSLIATLHEPISGEMVEITGTVHCATPLRSEYTSHPCVSYRSVTERVVQRHNRREKGGRLVGIIAPKRAAYRFPWR